MPKILLIAKRDYLAAAANKGFIIGLLVMPILIGVVFGAMALMGRPEIADQTIAIVDRSDAVADIVIAAMRQRNEQELLDPLTGKQRLPRYLFEKVPPEEDAGAQRLALSDRIRGGEVVVALEIGPQVLDPSAEGENARVTFYTQSGGLQLDGWLRTAMNDGVRHARLARMGIDTSRFEEVFRDVPVEPMNLVTRDATGRIEEARKRSQLENFAVPFMLTFLLMMVVMVGAMPMIGAVAEDKMQRVYEMLLPSASPFDLMAGKVLAAVALSLTSSVLYIAGGILALQSTAMLGLAPLSLLPWFFVYLITDVLMLSAIGAGLGAASSTPQDAQNLAIFLILPIVVPSMMMPVMLEQPNGPLATALSLFPPFTPLLMMLRQAMPGGVPAWQPWVGLVGMLSFAFAITWGAARVFRVGLLLQGKPPRLGEIVRWAWRG